MKIPKELEFALNKPEGARFYKCALQVNPYSYAAYRGNKIENEGEYNKAIAKACIQNNIEVVGLADHGDADSTINLKSVLEESGIAVFPGFEICSAEKIHMVCLFPSTITQQKLNQILGNIQGRPISENNKTEPSKNPLLEIAKMVRETGGEWYAAHIEEDNGLLKANDGSRGFCNIWKDEKLVIAGQIKGSIADLNLKYRQIIKNQDPNYKRENKVSVIHAKDVDEAGILSEPTASCLIKMSEPTIEALHQAFLDGDSRICFNSDVPPKHHSRIEATSIVGSEFYGEEGLHLHFNPNLNAIIGGRGTGKSTLLESIRYGLDAAYHSEDAEQRAKQILRKNLEGGKIILLIYSNRFEKKFIIERHYNQPPVVRNIDGHISNQSIKDILPGLEIFGQNEIFEIANIKSYHLQLINRFLPEKSNLHLPIIKNLRENRQKLIQAYEKLDELETENRQLSRLEEQQKSLQQLGLDKKFKESDIYNIEQKRLLLRSEQDLININLIIESFSETVKEIDLHYLSDESTKDIINKKLFQNLRSKWQNFKLELNAKVEELGLMLQAFRENIDKTNSVWEQRHEKFLSEFEDLINKLPDSGGKKGSHIAKEYSLISQKIAAIKGIGKDLSIQKKLVDSFERDRKSYLAELDDILLTQHQELAKTVKKLNNKKLAGRLKIIVERNGAKEKLNQFLTGLPGIGSKRISWINDIENLTIRQLVADILKGEEFLQKEYSITKGIAQALSEMGTGKLLELEEVTLEDKVNIQLNVSADEFPRFLDIENLSSGQRCTAILHLLMIDNIDPLIVDQPEDNLDNAFIANNIVEELRKQKEQRQFIFSTHNANIPVFGDAEWIGVMEIEDAVAMMQEESMGSIDKETLKPKVEEILEGGKHAFEIRRLKYGF